MKRKLIVSFNGKPIVYNILPRVFSRIYPLFGAECVFYLRGTFIFIH